MSRINTGVCLSTKIYITVFEKELQNSVSRETLIPCPLPFNFNEDMFIFLEKKHLRFWRAGELGIMFLFTFLRQCSEIASPRKTCTCHHENTEQDKFSSQGLLSSQLFMFDGDTLFSSDPIKPQLRQPMSKVRVHGLETVVY